MLTPDEIKSMVGRTDPTILDIGANDGEQTQVFLDLFPGASVFSFEPDPRAAKRFHVRVNDPRVELMIKAVGAKDGSTDFYGSSGWPGLAEKEKMPQGWDLSGSIKKPTGHLKQHPWCEFKHNWTVQVVRLDTWSAQRGIGKVDFIWADVQGAEGDLILGGADTLMRTRFFYVEYSNCELYEGQPTLEKLCGFLPYFEIVETYENDVLFRNKELS